PAASVLPQPALSAHILITSVTRLGLKLTLLSFGASSGTERFAASIRNATWSRPAASDISCIKLCTAKTCAQSPGARHEPVGIFSGNIVVARRRFGALTEYFRLSLRLAPVDSFLPSAVEVMKCS